MAAGVMKRFLFCVAILSIQHAESKPEAVTCVVRPADSGQRAVVCYFPFDLSTTKNTFALFQILPGKTDHVVTCNFLEEKVSCQIKEGFIKPNVTSNMATFLVPWDDISSFFCNTVPAISTVRTVNCSMEIEDALPTTPDTMVTDKDKREETFCLSTTEIAMCVIVLIVIIVPVAVVLVKRRKLLQKLCARCLLTLSGMRAREDGHNTGRERERKRQDGDQEPLKGVSQGTSDEADGLPHWCHCGHCRNMPREVERLCCRMTPCLSTTQKFLDMLEKAKVWEPRTQEFLDGKVVVTSKWRRFEFYKQFVDLYYGHLGKGQKSPVYSCCVWAMRNALPEEDGQYRGFIEGSQIVHIMKDWNQKYEDKQVSSV